MRWAWEAGKFGAVGAAAFLVDNATYFLLVTGPGQLLATAPVRASIMASLVATAFSYVGNRYWTFAQQRSAPSKRQVREAAAFVAANLIGIVITGACLYFSRWVLDLHSVAADAVARNIGIVLGTVFRYLAYKFWVFTAKPKETK
jgi:putative flippase GtrA